MRSRRQRSEIRRQRSEIRRQRSEIRRQRSEIEVGDQKSEEAQTGMSATPELIGPIYHEGAAAFKKVAESGKVADASNPYAAGSVEAESWACGFVDAEEGLYVPHPREITTHQCGAGMDEALTVLVLDEPGPGNACHEYVVGISPEKDLEEWPVACRISFQKGAVAEAGPNGISCEALIAVCIDRLEGFQSGDYPCEENAKALDHLQRALRTLQKRTIDRAEAGKEGRGEK